MANIKSQMKRNRQNEKLRIANKAVRSELRTRIKAAVAAAESGNEPDAREALRVAQVRIDKAASSGVMRKQTAARRKSQLTKQVNSLLG